MPMLHLQVRLDEVPGLGGLDRAVVVVVELLVERPDGGEAGLVGHPGLQRPVLLRPVHWGHGQANAG